MIDFKLLGTGTRWELLDPLLVARVFEKAHRYDKWDTFTLYIGDCPTGFDRLAREWWLDLFGVGAVRSSPAPLTELWTSPRGHRLFVFYADWYPRNDGKRDDRAGPRRNTRMVRYAHLDGCERFVAVTRRFGQARGTIDCRTKAELVGMYGPTVEA